MNKIFYNAENLTIKNGFIKNPDRYYLEEYFEQLPTVQYSKILSLIGRVPEYETTNTINERLLSSVPNDIDIDTIPAKSLIPGDVFHIFGFGTVISAAAAQQVTFRLIIDSTKNFNPSGNKTNLGESDALTPTTNDIVHIDYYLTIKSNGNNTLSLLGHGIITFGTTSPVIKNISVSETLVYNNNNDGLNIIFTNQWGAASTLNRMTMDSFVVEKKSPKEYNNNFMLVGTDSSVKCAQFDQEKGGIKITPLEITNSQVIITPNTNTNQSPWNNITWGTENELEWECALSLNYPSDSGPNPELLKVWSGLKKTSVSTVDTDSDQIYFLFEKATVAEIFNPKIWKIVVTINGDLYISKTPVVVVKDQIYKFRITIDKYRFARAYINDVQYNITDTITNTIGEEVTVGVNPTNKLTDNTNLIPYIGIEYLSTPTSDNLSNHNLNVYYQKISRNLV